MAALGALAVATDRNIHLLRERGEQVEEPLCARLAHLAVIVARVLAPACIGPRL